MRISGRNNKYFDVQLQTSPTKAQRLRVMESPNAKRSLFMEKCESKTPVKITGLSSTNAGSMPFFNTNFGHQLHDLNALPFLCANPAPLPIKDLKDTPQSDNFVVTGLINWHAEERVVQVGRNRIERRVRDAIIADNSAYMLLSIWGDLIDKITENSPCLLTNVITDNFNGIKLATTSASEVRETDESFTVDWNTIKPSFNKETVCCPLVTSAKIMKYLVCVNQDCKKKVNPYPGQKTVSCNTCKRKMLITRCKESFSCEVTIEDDSKRQILLTIFPKTLHQFFGDSNIDVDDYEDTLLAMENIDFEFTKKMIVTNMSLHDTVQPKDEAVTASPEQ